MKTHHIVMIVLMIICAVLLGRANLGLKKVTIPARKSGEETIKQEEKSVLRKMDSDESHPTTIEVIMKRKSVRKYTDEKVSEETLEKIVRAGMAAPTAANKQPWSFIIITDRETLDKLAEKMPYSKMLFKAPAAIVVCGVPKWGLPDRENDFWIQDCSAASENILLAVESLGLGAVWTGAYPIEQRVKDVRNILGIPKDVVPLNVIAIGHPTGVEKPKDKWKPERVHRNKW